MLRKMTCLLIIFSFVFLAGCFAIKHNVGDGAQGNTTVTERQWFILFGLVPINEVNSQTMAGGATDYEITTKMTFVDGLIGVFTGIVTVAPRSVIVKK